MCYQTLAIKSQQWQAAEWGVMDLWRWRNVTTCDWELLKASQCLIKESCGQYTTIRRNSLCPLPSGTKGRDPDATSPIGMNIYLPRIKSLPESLERAILDVQKQDTKIHTALALDSHEIPLCSLATVWVSFRSKNPKASTNILFATPMVNPQPRGLIL